VRRAADLATAAQPDVIVLTGDYVTRSTKFMRSGAAALAKLSAPLGVIAVLGNHDYWTDPDVVGHLLRDTAGARVLKNETEVLERSGEYLAIAGLDDPVTRNDDLDRTLAAVPPSCPVVLLAHTPDIAPKAAERGVDLVLAGHTHGGQVVLPWIGPPIVNSKHGKRLASGLAQVKGTKVYTNRGVGMAIVPIRINCPPEVALITLRRG
jgi:predicted MPP superfamily phosphohydrolase